MKKLSKIVSEKLKVSAQLKLQISEELNQKISKCVNITVDAYKNGHKVLFCGNGGSASDCQHLAAELVGRFKKERRALPAIALTSNVSILTALSNDYWNDLLFARQIEALGHEGDILFALSASGNSINIVRAVESAKIGNIYTIGLLGNEGGKLKNLVDLPVVVPSPSTDRIQEAHLTIGHIICELIEEELFR